MDADVAAAVGFSAAGVVTFLATPQAIALARKTEFYDRPREYRKHKAPTPFLGGTAVLAGVLAASAIVGGFSGRLLILIGCAIIMWLLGTVDDRFAVPPKWRLLAEAAVATALMVGHLGWHTSGGAGIDFVLTVVWIAGVVNAFNLMDNMDGACSTVGGISAAGIGTLAAVHGQAALAGMAFAVAGACLVFLRWNLAGPARIFLGDGGSMTIGFLIAALGMATSRHLGHGDASLLVISLTVGVAMLDTTLVSVSRFRRGVPLVTGGRDHLTHRLLAVLDEPWRVAGALAVVQAALCGTAILGDQLGNAAIGALAFAAVVLGITAIVILDSPRWRPAQIASGEPQGPDPSVRELERIGIESSR